jgi:molybdopterin synthase sulfur carrier subunit
MGARVLLHPYFDNIVKGEQTLEANGETIMQVVEDIDKKYPGFKAEVIDGTGKFYGFLEIFLNEEALFPYETGKRVKDGDEIDIVIMAGGG